MFRGLPAIITIYLVVFGLPLTQLPIVQDTANVDFELFSFQIPGTDLGATVVIDQLFILGVLALTLVYGAYVAEVYRSGIESIHWSQRAAARGPRALSGAVTALRDRASSRAPGDPAA